MRALRASMRCHAFGATIAAWHTIGSASRDISVTGASGAIVTMAPK